MRPSCRILIAAALLCLSSASPSWADSVRVDVNGIKGKLLKNVQGSLSIDQKHKDNWDERRIRRLFRVGRAEAKQALRPYGYYNPQIKAKLQEPVDGGDVWHVIYDIKAGPPTKINKLDLAITGPGAQLPALQQVLSDSKLQQGEQLNHADYKQTKSALSAAAYAAGFLDARFKQAAIRIHTHEQTADIALVLATGPRYYFGQVDIRQDFLDPGFVDKLVPIKPGQPFNANQLIDLQLVLADTDYFQQVLVQPAYDDVQHDLPLAPWFYHLLWPSTPIWPPPGQLRVPVEVSVKPTKPQHYRISAGYGTDTGPRVGFGVKFRHLNKYGHQLSIDTRISAIEQTLQSAYDIPIENVARDRLRFTAAVSNQKFGDITSNFARIGVLRDTGWALGRSKPYVRLQYERYDLGDGHGRRTARLLYPGYSWTMRRVDSEKRTRKGLAVDLDIRGADKWLGSSVNFARARLHGALILPMTARTRLLLRGTLGAIAVNDFDDLPPSQRFFAGGGSSVRGYGYQKLSPTNRDGDHVGGRYLATASIETDYRFYKDYYLAAFFDVGNASNHVDMDLKRGVGVGFRWDSPVGMIRLDLAHPLDDPHTSVRIHFSIGPAL